MLIKLLKMLWTIVIKDFIAGILVNTVRDIVKKWVDKTPWSVILERFLTRSLVACLKWLVSLNTNSLVTATANDFLLVLQGTGLKAAIPIKGATEEENSFQTDKGKTNEVYNREGSHGGQLAQTSLSESGQQPDRDANRVREEAA